MYDMQASFDAMVFVGLQEHSVHRGQNRSKALLCSSNNNQVYDTVIMPFSNYSSASLLGRKHGCNTLTPRSGYSI